MSGSPNAAGGLLLEKWQALGRASCNAKLGRVAIAVLWQLCERYNEKQGAAWPSFNRLAKDTGASVRQVKRAVIDLQGVNLISIIQRGDRLQSNRYRPNFSASDAHGTSLVPSASSGGDADDTDVVTFMSPESIYQSGHKAEIEINGICERHERTHTPPAGAGGIANASPASREANAELQTLIANFWRFYPKRIGVAEAEKLITSAFERSPEDAHQIINAAKQYATYVATKELTTGYQLAPAVFIREQRYRDDWQQLREQAQAEATRRRTRKTAGIAQNVTKPAKDGKGKVAQTQTPRTAPTREVDSPRRNQANGSFIPQRKTR